MWSRGWAQPKYAGRRAVTQEVSYAFLTQFDSVDRYQILYSRASVISDAVSLASTVEPNHVERCTGCAYWSHKPVLGGFDSQPPHPNTCLCSQGGHDTGLKSRLSQFDSECRHQIHLGVGKLGRSRLLWEQETAGSNPATLTKHAGESSGRLRSSPKPP